MIQDYSCVLPVLWTLHLQWHVIVAASAEATMPVPKDLPPGSNLQTAMCTPAPELNRGLQHPGLKPTTWHLPLTDLSILLMYLFYWCIYSTGVSFLLVYLFYWNIYSTGVSILLVYLFYWCIYSTGVSILLVYLFFWCIYSTDVSILLTYLFYRFNVWKGTDIIIYSYTWLLTPFNHDWEERKWEPPYLGKVVFEKMAIKCPCEVW